MSLQVRYNRITTAGGVEPDTVTVRAGVAFTHAAEEGAVGISEVIVDDPDNTLDYVGRRRLYAYESAAPAHNQMIFNGYLQQRRIGRLPPEGQDSDTEVMGRRWLLSVADTNSLLSRRLITGADGDRPAETDIARIQWLLDSNDAYLSNPQDNWENPSPYVDATGPIDMSANDYRGYTAFDVLNDCAQRSGKNWFVRYYEANDSVPPTNAGAYALWYADATSTLDSSTLRLTNIDADVDNVTTFAVLPDMILGRDPTRAVSGIFLTYDGGSTYVQSTNVANLFQQLDAAVSNPHVKAASEASALAARYLADAESEDDRLTCRLVVDKQYVNLLRDGQRFEAKFSHLPGYSAAYGWMRCLRRAVKHLNDEQYEIAIEATAAPTGPSIVQQAGGYSQLTDLTYSLPDPPTAGHYLIHVCGHRNGDLAASIPVPSDAGGNLVVTQFTSPVEIRIADIALGDGLWIMWSLSDGSEQTISWPQQNTHGFTYEVAGWDGASFQVLRQTTTTSATKAIGTFTGGTDHVAVAAWVADQGGAETPGAGWTQDYDADSASGGHPHVMVASSSGSTAGLAATATGGNVEWAGIAVDLRAP